jgi:hypothetical protein
MKLTIQRMLDLEAQASKQPKRTNRVMILFTSVRIEAGCVESL